MKAFHALLSFFGLCQHTSRYRERRKLHGLQVIHFVCEDCGHAEPAIDRTAKEHRQAVRTGRPVSLKATRSSVGNVAPMRKTGTR